MEKIETLSSLKGRKLLIELFKELRYEKQLSGLMVLIQTWRVCTRESELIRYIKKPVTLLHPLGFFSGTSLWMQEIVNRFYYTTIHSFVYFGAAILLALIGIRRFSEHISEPMIIAGVAFEALMLVFMFVVMLFSPNDDVMDSTDEKNDSGDDLLIEIGEIGRDLAASVSKIEDLTNSINQLIRQQHDLINLINQIAKNSADAVAPNPQMIEVMKSTNIALLEFNNTVAQLNKSAETLKTEAIESSVRKEIGKLLMNKLENPRT